MRINKQHTKAAQREPAEVVFFDELERLAAMDLGPVPPGWRMSPQAVEKFVMGDNGLGIERRLSIAGAGEPTRSG